MNRITVIACILLSVTAIAADKPAPVKQFNDHQARVLMQQERDYVLALKQQADAEQRTAQALQAFNATEAQFLKENGLDATKVDVNQNTLEVSLKPAPEPKKPAAPAPAEKK